MRSNNNVLYLAGLIIAAVWMGLFAAAAAESAGASSQAGPLSHRLQAMEPGAAWTELTNANHQAPPVPPEWNRTPPTAGEREKFYLPYIEAMADKSRDFYTRFPADTNAADAKLMEFQLLLVPLQWGQTKQLARVEAAANSLLNDPAISGEKHFQILWNMALNSPPNKSRPLFQEIVNGAAPDKLKAAAAAELKKLDALGKPLVLRFTAVDGRSVDLASLKGRVVLVDFWATWCPPCVAEIPDVKKTYDVFHAGGFEIVGISLDKDKDKLTQFVAAHKMEWPQFFDGLYWQNKYAVQFGIESIPAMWLIDKKGLLRDVDARANLGGAVQKLLAE
jgi:thiol-disulfide isomerase/thioredoxin